MKPVTAKHTGVVVAGVMLLALLTRDEGIRYPTYRDIAGVLTVCHEHTGPDVIEGKTYSQKECDAFLKKDTIKHGKAVLRCAKVPLNQNQYEAFTRFAFNVGPGAFCGSTLVKKLNAGDYDGACRELLRWDKARVNGVLRPVKGLTARRQSEYQQCIKPIESPKAQDVA